MRTLVLAGGLATRMPFKPLLVVDGVGRCTLHRIMDELGDEAEVVVREGSPVHAFCLHRNWKIRFQTEPHLAGALRACLDGEEPARIFLADNVYPSQLMDVAPALDSACVADRSIPGLAHWCPISETWFRDEPSKISRALISPWFLSAKTLRTARWDQAHLIFEDAGVRPFYTSSRGWYDIGTEEGYRKLWDENL